MIQPKSNQFEGDASDTATKKVLNSSHLEADQVFRKGNCEFQLNQREREKERKREREKERKREREKERKRERERERTDIKRRKFEMT